MNKSCLIKGHSAGLGSILNNAMMWSFQYPKIHIDWTDCIYGPKTWESLFEPLPLPPEPFDTVCVHPESAEYPWAWITWRWAAMLYQGTNPEHLDWRERCHEKWLQHFKVLPEITAWVDRFVAENFKGKTICAQVRWHGHSAEQLPPFRSQTWEDYARVLRENGADTVYVAAGDYASVDWFRSKLPNVVFHPTARRSQDRNSDVTKALRLTEQDAIDVLQEILLASRCDTLIHVISNMATASLYINPSLKSIFLP